MQVCFRCLSLPPSAVMECFVIHLLHLQDAGGYIEHPRARFDPRHVILVGVMF